MVNFIPFSSHGWRLSHAYGLYIRGGTPSEVPLPFRAVFCITFGNLYCLSLCIQWFVFCEVWRVLMNWWFECLGYEQDWHRRPFLSWVFMLSGCGDEQEWSWRFSMNWFFCQLTIPGPGVCAGMVLKAFAELGLCQLIISGCKELKEWFIVWCIELQDWSVAGYS